VSASFIDFTGFAHCHTFCFYFINWNFQRCVCKVGKGAFNFL